MKYFILIACVFAMNSCNTSIGLWRDTKMGYNWTKAKIQGNGGGGGYDEGAPVY
jgi:predicted small secreted protein